MQLICLLIVFFTALTFAIRDNKGENASIDGYKKVNFFDENNNLLPSVVLDAGKDASGGQLKLKIRLDCIPDNPNVERYDNSCDAHFFLKKKTNSIESIYKYLFTTRYDGESLNRTVFSIKDNEVAISAGTNGMGRFAVYSSWVEKVQISPLRYISSYEETSGGMGGGSENSSKEINYKSGLATNSDSYFNCKRPDQRDEDYHDENGFYPAARTWSDFVPLIKLSDSAKKNWKTLNIENCSQHPKFNTSKNTPNGTYRVLAIEPNVFLVDFLKEELTLNSKSWIYDDHLEIWLATKRSDDHCHDEVNVKKNISKFGMAQWGIMPKSGKIINAAGNAELKLAAETSEIVKNKKIVGYRMKVEIPGFIPEENSISLSFVEGDGKTQELFSTSKVAYGNSYSLGKTIKTVCNEKDGILNWELPEIFDAGIFENKNLPDESEKNPVLTEKVIGLLEKRKNMGCDDFKKNHSMIHYSQITNTNGRGPDEFIKFGTSTIGIVRPKGGSYNRFQFHNVQEIECNQFLLDDETMGSSSDQVKSIPKFFTRKFDLSDIILEPGKYRLRLGPNSNFEGQVLPALSGTVAINGTTVLKLEDYCTNPADIITNTELKIQMCKSKSPFTVEIEIQKNSSLQATITYERNSTIEFDMYKLASISK